MFDKNLTEQTNSQQDEKCVVMQSPVTFVAERQF
jgi:hypothetical protein